MKTWTAILSLVNSLLFISIHSGLGQGLDKIDVTAKGTGQTTGHIADLNIRNHNNTEVKILTLFVYIPSDGHYQSYIAEVPPVTVQPHATEVVPLQGYCTDIHVPPVPAGKEFPPISEWIPVVKPTAIPDPNGISIFPHATVPNFDPKDIPTITGSPNFKPLSPDIIADIPVTWPGTDTPVGGTLDPTPRPEIYAPVITKVLINIEDAVQKLQEDKKIATPFSPDPNKESESVIQQVIWVYTAALAGKKYNRDDFSTKVYDQFNDQSGIKIADLPEKEKNKLDMGVDQFWNSFMATGVEAKVIIASDQSSNHASAEVAGDHKQDDNTADQEEKIACGRIKGNVKTDPESVRKSLKDIVVYVTSTCNFCPPPPSYEPKVVEEDENSIHPSFLVVPQDSSVTIKNSMVKEIDIAPGLVPSPTDASRTLTLKSLSRGESTTFTPTKPGGYLVKNDINKMHDGILFVAPNQCYCITDKDGNYGIGELPPGTYHLKVYTNPKRTNFAEADVVVEAGKVTIQDFVLDRVVVDEKGKQ